MESEQILNTIEQPEDEPIFTIDEQIEYIAEEVKIKDEFIELIKDGNPEEVEMARKEAALMREVLETLHFHKMIEMMADEENFPMFEESRC